MSRIRLLPETLANQIAAGEVVQRPASVVKELLENAIDAGASHIKLLVKDGGKALIQVIDDGTGMDETDARMCFERHATSKIASTDDLFNIRTKGFRGEALASIAAVSHVELRTKTGEQEVGTLVKVEGGRVVHQEPVSTPKGTSVAVKNLFFNVPARRKFLKSAQVEMRHIIDEFQRVALAHPEIAFTLIHNGHELYRLPPAKTLQRIEHIFGRKMGQRLVPVREQTDYIKIYGYTGKPEFAKQRRGEQFFFVNRRFFKSSYLHSAVMQAYEGLVADKKIPPYFIYFEIDPRHIDVNIHPTKTEIKFDDEYTVYNLLRAAVRHALGKFNQMPSIDFDLDPQFIPRDPAPSKKIDTPKIRVNPRFNPFKDDGASTPFLNEPAADPDFSSFASAPAEKPKELFEAAGAQSAAEQPVFQWKDKFLVTKMTGGLMLVHQHRAHKSVLFERYARQLQAQTLPSQQLLFPVEWEYFDNELALIDKHTPLLERLGIRFERGDGKIRVTAVPSGTETAQIKDFLDELLAYWAEDIPLEGNELDRFLARTLAEKTAIRTGQKLTPAQQQQLLSQLFQLAEPAFDPSGKRNFIILPVEDIDNRFE